MYVTRPLWLCKQKASTLSNTSTPENPNSGCLVVSSSHEELETIIEIFPGNIRKANKHDKLPLLQNYFTDVVYSSGDYDDFGGYVKSNVIVWFIPVLDQPPFSNRYYAIVPTGKYQGQAWTCARKKDMPSKFFGKLRSRKDFKPSVFDRTNIYQQMKIENKNGGFVAKSVAPDGVPPSFLSKPQWNVFYNNNDNLNFHGEASGLNTTLRLRLPNLVNFPISTSSNHDYSNTDRNVDVGKWYCPSFFIREEISNPHIVHPSSFYEMTLEQYWEEIYKSEYNNDDSQGHGNKNTVVASQVVEKQSFMLFGEKAVKDETNGGVGSSDGGDDMFVWLRHDKPTEGRRIGLSVAVIEKMKCIQELGGWSGEGDNAARVTKVEKFSGGEGSHGWKRFGCFVLVERFALRRMDGTLVLTCDYKHLNQIQCKWESNE